MDITANTAAEQLVLDSIQSPSRITVGDGTTPKESRDDNHVSANFIRSVLSCGVLEGTKGLRLRGAWVDGMVDLQGLNISHDISFTGCHFDEPLSLVNAHLRSLNISACFLCGISAENAHFDGPVYIRGETTIEGELNLSGAFVDGDVQLCGATIGGQGQDAIFAPSLEIHGSLFLGNYPYSTPATSLVCDGTVFFSSLRVDHDVYVTNCAIAVRDHSEFETMFGATEEHGADVALSLARARIGGLLFFMDNQITRGLVNLAGADVRRLKDEPIGPGAAYPIRLDGFTYQDFSRHTDTNVKARLSWLDRRPSDTPFIAQPYEHLAKVLTALGHRHDAQTVLMHKERLLRLENRSHQSGLSRLASLGLDGVLRWTVGYGYRPGRALVLALFCILGLSAVFYKTWHTGDFAPNAAPVLVSANWEKATDLAPQNPAQYWATQTAAGLDWETFHPIAYAADLFIPIVDLGQESAWAPSTARSNWGWISWWLRWFAKGLGWIVTALGAAAVTGLIRRD